MTTETAGVPLTLAERSDFRQTGRSDEVERLCEAYAQRWPDAVRSFEYGRSAEGRPMYAMLVSRSGALSPEEIRRRQLPVLMLQAGIHPGESDGKDAGFIVLRELLSGSVAPGVLEHIAILFVPAFNIDGHERCGRWNRPNQVGPEETGWRATAQNLNLNRDYTKADAPEMQAMLRLLQRWDPLLCADLHVTDGADFEPDISLQVEPIHQGDPQLFASGVQMRDELIDKLSRQGSLPLPFYPDLVQTDDPSGGFHLTVYSPRFSTGYFPSRNRYTVLVETHSWKDYATRVRVTRNTLVGLAELTAAHGARWLQETQRADEDAKTLAGQQVVLEFASGWREPTQEKSAAVSGAADAPWRIRSSKPTSSPTTGSWGIAAKPTRYAVPLIWTSLYTGLTGVSCPSCAQGTAAASVSPTRNRRLSHRIDRESARVDDQARGTKVERTTLFLPGSQLQERDRCGRRGLCRHDAAWRRGHSTRTRAKCSSTGPRGTAPQFGTVTPLV